MKNQNYIEKTKQKIKKCVIIDFCKRSNAIAVGTGIAFIYVIICAIFKTSDSLNVSDTLRIWGEVLLNISYSIIAAALFYIFQVYVPTIRRIQIREKESQRCIENYLIKNIKYLQEQLKLLEQGEKTEKDLLQGITYTSNGIINAADRCFLYYVDIIAEDVLDIINDIVDNPVFDLINKRANGKLVGYSISDIIRDDTANHDKLLKCFDTIRQIYKK